MLLQTSLSLVYSSLSIWFTPLFIKIYSTGSLYASTHQFATWIHSTQYNSTSLYASTHRFATWIYPTQYNSGSLYACAKFPQGNLQFTHHYLSGLALVFIKIHSNVLTLYYFAISIYTTQHNSTSLYASTDFTQLSLLFTRHYLSRLALGFIKIYSISSHSLSTDLCNFALHNSV
jgi:hypothetical protein